MCVCLSVNLKTTFDFRTAKKVNTAVVAFTTNFGDDYHVPMRKEQLVNHGGITLETQVAPGAEKYELFGNIKLSENDIYHATTSFEIQF